MTDLFLRDFHNDLDKLHKFFFLNLIVFNLCFYFFNVAIFFGLVLIDFLLTILLGLITALIFSLYFYFAYKIMNKIGDFKSKEIFKLIQILNLTPFIAIFLNFFRSYILINSILGYILVAFLYLIKFKRLKKLGGTEKLFYSIRNFSIIVFFGMILLFFFLVNLIGVIIISFGMIIIDRKTFQFVNQGDFLTLSTSLTHQEIHDNRVLRTEIKPELVKLRENVKNEEISQPIPETTILKAEIKPNLVKQTEITIEDEISQPTPEPTVLKPEIKPVLVKQPEIKPETEITSKKIKTKKKGLLNFKINRKIVSEKPIRSKIIKKEAKPQVPKKRCPFCGKEHDDLNVEFCYSCGYKF